ncbi:MAG: replicative helicase [Anaerosolibacter sp.]|jgi:hypothetical protein|uniref:replicative DNA helicase n=1 Tax=Anaerosolibacter sp. TaxID=1872527 RepID=UPI00262D47BC|nr:replicative DNA helicase [Anaerosolibacter sp.]MDF2548259.1 replicative helicase [Anaerosolibacter sp.]
MEATVNHVTAYYRERIQRISLFDPLYRLENKKLKDRRDRPIDFFGLGLVALLFFFENMLMRNKRIGTKELKQFLYILNQGEMDLSEDDFEKIAREIIQAFRPPSGKRNFRIFYNWETRQEEIVQCSILKASEFDPTTNTQYYVLDEQGLELVFATKEYFTEFQLSISQLVLRKQLEKGEFVGALRQIDEMRMDVQGLQDKIYRVKHEIQRNIISDETYERYKAIVEDIHLRLSRENEEFEELQTFVRETKERLGYEMQEDKERRAYELVLKIDHQLGEVHYDHRQLLEESIGLKITALLAAQESLYYVGIDAFNFNDQVTNRLLSIPLPLESSKTLVEPFLFLEQKQQWSPITVFAKQRIEKVENDETTTAFLEFLSEEQLKKDMETQQQNFKQVMAAVLEVMGNEKEVTIVQVVQHLKETPRQGMLTHRSFYDFWLILHQKAPVSLKRDKEQQVHVLDEALDLLKDKGTIIHVVEAEGFVKGSQRYTIRNLKIQLEGE